MNRLFLFALFLVVGWYVWWRIRRWFARVTVTKRDAGVERKPAGPLTLEKDPVTGVYRPPRD